MVSDQYSIKEDPDRQHGVTPFNRVFRFFCSGFNRIPASFLSRNRYTGREHSRDYTFILVKKRSVS